MTVLSYYRLCHVKLIIFDYLADCTHLKCFVEVNKSIIKKYPETTLLSNLHEIGVEFDALIYNLPENTGYNEFHTKCKLVLDALNRHSYLTNTMVSFITFIAITMFDRGIKIIHYMYVIVFTYIIL